MPTGVTSLFKSISRTFSHHLNSSTLEKGIRVTIDYRMHAEIQSVIDLYESYPIKSEIKELVQYMESGSSSLMLAPLNHKHIKVMETLVQ